MLTQNFAIRHGRYGSRASAISPGTVRTPIWDERLALGPRVRDSLRSWYPLGRVGEVEDVAVVLFLRSNDASCSTGINLPVEGGLTAGNGRMVDDLGNCGSG